MSFAINHTPLLLICLSRYHSLPPIHKRPHTIISNVPLSLGAANEGLSIKGCPLRVTMRPITTSKPAFSVSELCSHHFPTPPLSHHQRLNADERSWDLSIRAVYPSLPNLDHPIPLLSCFLLKPHEFYNMNKL